MTRNFAPQKKKALALAKAAASCILILLGFVLSFLSWFIKWLFAAWRRFRDKPAGKGSLRLRLSVFFAFFMVLAWGCAAIMSWHECRDYVDEFFDTQQALFARRMAASNFESTHLWMSDKSKMTPGFSKNNKGDIDDEALAFAIFTNEGALVQSDGKNGQRFIYPGFTRGFVNGPIANSKKDWRIFWLNSLDGTHVVAAGQQLEYRFEIALELLDEQIMPWVLLLPVLLAGLVLLITRELAPLRQMAAQLHTRAPEDDTPLDVQNIPQEARPLVEELNSLFQRTANLLKRERAFISDASHELRTPLAGLRVQAQVAREAADNPELRDEALTNLLDGIDRSARMVEQLLALSRLESIAEAEGKSSVSGMERTTADWSAMLDDIVQQYALRAKSKQIDIDYQNNGLTPEIKTYPNLILMLLRNLMENAVHYTPQGGQIRIRLGSGYLVFENDSEELPAEYAARLGERFFRPPGQKQPGSGLGLAIIRRVSEINEFRLSLEPFVQSTLVDKKVFRVSIYW